MVLLENGSIPFRWLWVIIIRCKDDVLISAPMQNAMNIIWWWCLGEHLKINPHKMSFGRYTERNAVNIKYLDYYFRSNIYLEYSSPKKRALWVSHRLFGKIRGFKPKMILWPYLAIIRPIRVVLGNLLYRSSQIWSPQVGGSPQLKFCLFDLLINRVTCHGDLASMIE